MLGPRTYCWSKCGCAFPISVSGLDIGKITSKDEETRKTGIKQLAGMPPTKRGFHALVAALDREESKDLRREIVRALRLHVGYGSDD